MRSYENNHRHNLSQNISATRTKIRFYYDNDKK